MNEEEKKVWQEIRYKHKFLNAFKGMYLAFKVTSHSFIHILGTLLVIILGFYFKVSGIEWAILVFSISFVIVAEMFNTAIEIDMDLTSPKYHPFARDTKDVAAGAVLLAVFGSVVVGLIVFLPKIFVL